MAPKTARTVQSEVHFCRFCGLRVSEGESHGTEAECIEALRLEVQGRVAARVRSGVNTDREKDKPTLTVVGV